MSIKSILTVFGGWPQELNVLESSLSLAHACRARLRVLHIVELPVLIDATGMGMYASMSCPDPATIDMLDEQTQLLTKQAEAYTRDYCQRQAVPLQIEGTEVMMGQAQATFRTVIGDTRYCLAQQAATSDLIVMGYGTSPHVDIDIILAGLEADRPVLALPVNPAATLPSTGFGRTVVFAWDGSRACTRALREAVSHMLHAINVFVLHVPAVGEDPDNQNKSEVMAYLRSHCIPAEYLRIERDTRKVGECILEQARRLNADLLIMGAYGQGHVSEMILGGVTDHVLKHADLPLLLVH